MPGIKTVRFTVEGRVSFPIDMLRYDSAFPDTELDAGLIEATYRRGAHGIVAVRLVSHDDGAPTKARWASFMWRVVT